MKSIMVSNNIIPVAKFKSEMARYLREIKENRSSLIITQNGVAAGVLMSPAEFDEMRATKLFIDSISRGLSDSENGKIVSGEEVRLRFQKKKGVSKK